VLLEEIKRPSTVGSHLDVDNYVIMLHAPCPPAYILSRTVSGTFSDTDFSGLENGLAKFHDFSCLSMTSGHPDRR